jgi:hypothetical protein
VAGLLLGILSNIVSLVIVGALVGTWYLLRRRPLLVFFGLKRSHRVVIYPSRLKVQSSLGVDDIERSFGATATPEYEAKIIAEITAFFERFTPRIFRWLDAPLLRWGDIKVEVAWPASKEEIEHNSTLIVIGSPGYNLVSKAVELDFNAPVRFASDNCELATRAGVPIGGAAFGVVQRVKDRTAGQVAFYLAGPSAEGTTAAANYLLQEWRRLAKRHRRCEFYEVVQATGRQGEQYVVVPASVP